MRQLLVYSDALSWGIVPAIASASDGIHLDAAQHAVLGTALATAVAALLPVRPAA